MAVMDDIKAEWKKMRGKPLAERIRYFVSYYKWYVVACVAVIAVLATILVGYMLKKEPILSGIMLNSSSASSESAYDDFSNRFLEEIGVNGKEYEVSITSNLTYLPNNEENAPNNYGTVQSLLAQTSGGLLDFMIGNLSSVQSLAYSQFFVDLSEVMSQEQLQQLAPYICYIDLAVIEMIEAAVEAGDYEADIPIPDCKKPEEMQRPMAAFLDVSSSDWLSEIYPYAAEPIVLAVAVNVPHKEVLLMLIDCLLQQQG